MSFALTRIERRALFLVVALLVMLRLVTLATYPVMDSTESRYAEIARKMLETGDWLVPQFAYGVPFWGKPPLSTWLSAASMAVFGVNEFAARLPSLLLLLGCGALVFDLARLRAGRDGALWACTFFATCGLVFVAAGAVMTDAALTLGSTLAMAGFWIALDGPPARRRVAGYTFFVGLAIGMMAKGPIALVLTFIPIGAWMLWARSWRAVWTGLPWLTGSVFAAVLVVPWYWAAERASPGFLNYFLLGEHWKRFVESGWKGDLYGVAHARPRGLIWLFWIAAVLPWSLLAIGWLARAALFRRDTLRTLVGDPWQAYLLLWVLAPMLFFTLSGNILATYVLPGLPAFALLLAVLWRPDNDDMRSLRPPVRLAIAAGIVLTCVFVGAILAMRPHFENEFSQKALVNAYEAQRDHTSERLIYFGPAPSSAEFYTQGKVITVRDTAALMPHLADADADFIAMRVRELASLPTEFRSRLSPVGRFGEYQLLHEVVTIPK